MIRIRTMNDIFALVRIQSVLMCSRWLLKMSCFHYYYVGGRADAFVFVLFVKIVCIVYNAKTMTITFCYGASIARRRRIIIIMITYL